MRSSSSTRGRLSLPEVEQNLVDLARLNRLPGGTAASVDAIRHLIGSRPDPRILDAGTGQADMPVAFAHHGWRTVALDPNPDVLLIARRATENERRVEVVEGDVRRLPFSDGEFDVAHCSLLIHHLEPDEAVSALRELAPGRSPRRCRQRPPPWNPADGGNVGHGHRARSQPGHQAGRHDLGSARLHAR